MTATPPGEPYGYTFAPRADRDLAELPEGIATACVEFIAHRLVTNPRRIGKALHGRLEGQHSAHLGDHRVVYVIDEQRHRIRVTGIGRRADIYLR